VDTVHNTTLAFVSLDEKGDRSFSFYRRFGADVFISPDDVNTDIISNSTFFHFGSLSLTTEPAISATEFAIKNARNSGCIITYDPNYRELLWENAETSIKTMRKFLFYADIVKVSREEALMISGCEDIESSVSALLNFGISILLITDGENGVHFATAYQRGFLPSTRACVVDTTGAGDIFFGSFLYGLIKDKVCKKELEKIDITKYVRTAIHLAGKSTEKKGAISSIPPYEEYDS
jgi:fructokinase